LHDVISSIRSWRRCVGAVGVAPLDEAPCVRHARRSSSGRRTRRTFSVAHARILGASTCSRATSSTSSPARRHRRPRIRKPGPGGERHRTRRGFVQSFVEQTPMDKLAPVLPVRGRGAALGTRARGGDGNVQQGDDVLVVTASSRADPSPDVRRGGFPSEILASRIDSSAQYQGRRTADGQDSSTPRRVTPET